jgi:uncharacterized radical SAM superfamily protein
MNQTSANSPKSDNLGTRRIPKLRMAKFPSADDIVRQGLQEARPSKSSVDVVLVNPPTPDGGLWIRTQHRVGRRSRENMVWPQVSLAQMAALLHPVYSVRVIDANAERMSWIEFTALLDELKPKYYLTQVTAPTLENDMYGCFLAKAREPDLTLRDLIDRLEDGFDQRSPEIELLFSKSDPGYQPEADGNRESLLAAIKGLAWRKGEEIVVNPPRPFVADLDDLPQPMHELLPLTKYRMPLIKGPFTFIVTSRGCPAGCTYCIKHVSYQFSTRLRSPEKLVEEMWSLKKLGINNIHMYADLFTVSREQVVELCQLMIDQQINVKWTCNSRVDYVDEEMLQLMGESGCRLISWGIESGNEQILRNVRKGAYPEKAERALRWAKKAGIMNWGYFIIGLPGETEETIRQTIDFSKQLPLDIALFHVAAPYPGTPFFFEVVEKGWFRKGTRWEQVDMDRETVLDYPDLSAEQLLYWQKRAFREWAMRPGPLWTYTKMLFYDWSTMKTALNVGFQHLSWASTDTGLPT